MAGLTIERTAVSLIQIGDWGYRVYRRIADGREPRVGIWFPLLKLVVGFIGYTSIDKSMLSL